MIRTYRRRFVREPVPRGELLGNLPVTLTPPVETKKGTWANPQAPDLDPLEPVLYVPVARGLK